MTPEELAKREEEEFSTGPLSILTTSVKNNTQVINSPFLIRSSCFIVEINPILHSTIYLGLLFIILSMIY